MINGLNSSMMASMSGMIQNMPAPQGGNMFQKVDSSGDGSIDSAEFSTMAQQLSETSETEIDTETAMTSYDSDGDGGLSGDELKSFLDDNGFAPPEREMGGQPPKGGGGMQGPPPPPQESDSTSGITSEGIQAYLQQLTNGTTDETDFVSMLMEQFSDQSDQQTYSPFDILT